MRLNALWWWIDRWRKSTAYTGMSLEEQGAYRNLLDEATLRGGALPSDEQILARICGDSRRWRKVRGSVLARFVPIGDGQIAPNHAEVRLFMSRHRRLPSMVEHAGWRPSIPMSIARQVFDRDGGRCVFCGSSARLEVLDHILRWRDGGRHTEDNLRLLLCRPCNRSRG